MRRRHRQLPVARGDARARERGAAQALQEGRMAREYGPRRDLPG